MIYPLVQRYAPEMEKNGSCAGVGLSRFFARAFTWMKPVGVQRQWPLGVSRLGRRQPGP